MFVCLCVCVCVCVLAGRNYCNLAAVRYAIPTDGLPPAKDWLTVLESMLFTGVDLQREPLSVNDPWLHVF